MGRKGFKSGNAIALDDRVDPGIRLCGGLEIGKRKYRRHVLTRSYTLRSLLSVMVTHLGYQSLNRGTISGK
jgi:hypothetical protein